MRKLFEKFLSRKPAHHDRSSIQVTIDALVLNDEAKDDIEPSVILKPIIKPGPPEAGWFGGDPMLPADSDWPQIDSISLCFLAQIDLSKLPQPIWSGVGPRDGYLVFFVHPERCEVRVLHVKDGLVPRSADVPQPNHCWGGGRKYYPFNKFPVTAIQNVGQMPEPIGWILGRHKDFPHPFGGDEEKIDLTDQQHQPFDAKSRDLLIQSLLDPIGNRLKQCADQLEQKSPGAGELEQKSQAEDEDRVRKLEAVRTELISLASEVNRARRAFLEAAQEFRQEPFDQNKVAIFIERLLPLPLPDFNLKRDKDGVIVGIELVATSLSELDQSRWSNAAGRYRNFLDNYLFEHFVRGRRRLPPPQRNRIEKICEFRAQYESGGMSHAPHGFIYTAHGQNSKNEVLLELPSSLLVGWMWADSASIVILINREDLKNGRFDKVITDVTN